MATTPNSDESHSFKMYNMEKKLRGAPMILKQLLLYAEVGDIVEVYWEKLDPYYVHVSTSPSFKYRLFRMGSSTAIQPKLFTRLGSIPAPVPYHNDTIVFISPLMCALDIKLFIGLMDDYDRGRIKRLAMNGKLFGWIDPLPGVAQLDLQVLTRYTNLREIIITSEFATEIGKQPLGPTATISEKIDFEWATSTTSRHKLPFDAQDCRMQTEAILRTLRDKYSAWPGGPVIVDIVSVYRDGMQQPTEFKTKRQLEFKDRRKKAEDDEVDSQIALMDQKHEGYEMEKFILKASEGEDEDNQDGREDGEVGESNEDEESEDAEDSIVFDDNDSF
jgi:hypothetical protein